MANAPAYRLVRHEFPERPQESWPPPPMTSPLSIALIGYRGTGKTTVARRLALQLQYDWVDADVEIELRAVKSIAEIFQQSGEAAFRDLETQMVAELCCRQKTILALGGGSIFAEKNR